MIHVAETTVGRRYAGWFIRNTEHAQRVLDTLRATPLPVPQKAGGGGQNINNNSSNVVGNGPRANIGEVGARPGVATGGGGGGSKSGNAWGGAAARKVEIVAAH